MPANASLGVDIGGTKILCVLMDTKKSVIAELKFKTQANKGCERLLAELTASLKELRKKAASHKLEVVGVGIGCAGQVDPEKLLIRTSPNILCLEGCQIGKAIERALGLKSVLGNDVQMGLSGEHKAGAAKGCAHVLGVFFGTGVGGATIINNRLYKGASDMAGQVGAVLAQPVGGAEAAQSHGIIDRIAAKSAIAAEAAQMAAKNWAPYLSKHGGTDLSDLGWGVLAKAIQQGDERIKEMISARMYVVGIALSNIVNFLNPEMLVLGGGLLEEMPKLVMRELERGLRTHLVPEVGEVLQIKKAKLGGQAVAIGAALMALDQLA